MAGKEAKSSAAAAPPQTKPSSQPLLSPAAIVATCLALSIGWGVRGNYGHETGAMLPGALAAMTACLFSRRADWHARLPYFALFGMLGWAFGGSISYMQVIGYTHSGHAESQLFGFYGLFLIGFLWAALGGMGAALPAVLDQKRLEAMFRPLCFLIGAWAVLYFAGETIEGFVQQLFEQSGAPAPSRRQESALYWLDSDWFPIACILGVLLWLDWDDRGYERPLLLAGLVAGGATIGWGLLWIGAATGANTAIAGAIVQPQGLFEDRFVASDLAVTNWPPLLMHLGAMKWLAYPGEALGLLLGAIAGAGLFFARFGRFAGGSALFLHMALGWWIGFLLLPVFGSLFLAEYGGLRLTPPRGDNWAGVLGTWIGATAYCLRHGLRRVAAAGLLCGAIGGLGFAGAAWAESMLVSLGNPYAGADAEMQDHWRAWQSTTWEKADWKAEQRMPPPAEAAALETPPAWRHWQGQNWHSFLEQSYGFINGLGVVLALALVARRTPDLGDSFPRRRWTVVFSLAMALPVLGFVNLVKNVRDWTEGDAPALPVKMAAPFIGWELSAYAWFCLFYFATAAAFVWLLTRHLQRPLAVAPRSWLGRGQLLLMLLLWAFVLGNFAKALPHFQAGRLLTEGIILLSGVVLTLLVLAAAGSATKSIQANAAAEASWLKSLWAPALTAIFLAAAAPPAMWYSVRSVYGDARTGRRGMDYRFGPNANWKRAPLLRDVDHR